jgi:hypothetical protein
MGASPETICTYLTDYCTITDIIPRFGKENQDDRRRALRIAKKINKQTVGCSSYQVNNQLEISYTVVMKLLM